jgi:LysM repeat protein
MKWFYSMWFCFLLFTQLVFSQESITHKVERGETIADIAKKYQITPYDIYKLNPDAQTKLKPRMVLLIPSKMALKVSNVEITHKVMPKETLYGIEKKYNVSDADLKKANPILEKEGLQIDQILVIPSKNAIQSFEKAVYHDVQPKETKYSIAKQYGVTVEELEKRNPEIVSNLPVGFHLLIKGKSENNIDATNTNTNTSPNYLSYEVKPKETLYSLSKIAGMSQDEFIALNSDLKNGVEIGMVVKMPANIIAPAVVEKKVHTNLTPKLNSAERKKIALLLPFNVERIQGDLDNSTIERLKKDKFLNMTLDFYAGALIAIDSAKTLGLPIDVSIFDSDETKNGSNVTAIINSNNLQSADAVVGPFYQSNAEEAARLLSVANVPVISPLSKDGGNPVANLYQTIPTNDVLKSTMFDFMRSKKGNIIAVVDRKKVSVIDYLKQNQSDVRLVPLNDNGSVSAESIRSMLDPNRVNYVLMETANTWMVKTTISALVGAMSNYQVQLVVLELNGTLDSDEISFTNLVKLKLMYPSVTRDGISPEEIVFENKFKKLNSVAPSDYATRGFDVTFDTLMRLMQNKSFEETANTIASQQFENKFDYFKKEDGGYANKGVYILYYDSDLTVKVAN